MAIKHKAGIIMLFFAFDDKKFSANAVYYNVIDNNTDYSIGIEKMLHLFRST